MQIKIRKFKESDARKISFLIRKNLTDINSKYYPKKVIDFMYAWFTPKNIINESKKRETYVAVFKKNVVGCGNIDKKGIHQMFVNPKLHNKGIGKKIVLFLENIAKKKKMRKMNLVSSKNAVGFYIKLGYKKIKIVKCGEWGNNILMRKSLK